jgi:hypothetical protein
MHLVLVGKFRSKIPSIAAVSVIGAFAVIGLSYSLMPADEPSSLAVAEAGQGKDTYLISAHGSPQTTFTIREMSIKR